MKNLEHTIEEIDDKVNPLPSTRMQNVLGMFQTVSVAPTATPFNWQNQVQIYVNGATLRLYWYDTSANTWHYVTATA